MSEEKWKRYKREKAKAKVAIVCDVAESKPWFHGTGVGSIVTIAPEALLACVSWKAGMG